LVVTVAVLLVVGGFALYGALTTKSAGHLKGAGQALAPAATVTTAGGPGLAG
jgi:hypothetical protein